MPPQPDYRPRVGVPWRTVREEKPHQPGPLDSYLAAVRHAGGEPVAVSLVLPPRELARLADSLDAVLLSGSPADVDPRRYGAPPHAKAAPPDKDRERTDDFLLDHAFATGKPVLAICYGIQLLNVHLGGSLLQDIPSELKTAPKVNHSPRLWKLHPVHIEGGRLAGLVRESNGHSPMRVNSSHHQAVLHPGRGLQVTARSLDGVIEAVEWTGDGNWVIGVQWHPERMRGDALAEALFRELIARAGRRIAPSV